MTHLMPDNKGSYVFGEGYTVAIETALEKGSDTKLKVVFDFSECDEARVAYTAAKDLLSDFNNKRRQAEKDTVLKDGTTREGVSQIEAARAYAVYDERTDTYNIRVKDQWSKVRTVGQKQKSITAQAEEMTAEKLAAAIAELQKTLEAKLAQK